MLGLDVHISAPGYLDKGRPRFTEITEEYEEESNRDNAKKEPTISEKEAIKKGLNVKKKGMRKLDHL